jgi:hypothetical protein
LESTPILTFRFPDGDVEHRSVEGAISTGTYIRSRGVMWRVIRLESHVVHLGPDDRQPGPDGGPILTPIPLGDGVPDFEVMTEI